MYRSLVFSFLILGAPSHWAPEELSCASIVVEERMLPVSGIVVTRTCMEAYGPWDEEGLRACEGELLSDTLTLYSGFEEGSYLLLLCDDAPAYLIADSRPATQTSWSALKKLFR